MPDFDRVRHGGAGSINDVNLPGYAARGHIEPRAIGRNGQAARAAGQCDDSLDASRR